MTYVEVNVPILLFILFIFSHMANQHTFCKDPKGLRSTVIKKYYRNLEFGKGGVSNQWAKMVVLYVALELLAAFWKNVP